MSNPTPTLDLRWLYVDFNSYFASVEQEIDPRLRGKPVAVLPVMTDATSAIAASYEAKAFGVKTGTPIYEAKKMCPGLICVLAKHDKYVEYHQKILTEIDNHIPVTKVCSIDEVACSLMKNERTPERVTEIAAGIKRGLAKNVGQFIKCSIGVAPSKYLAKVATDMKKPDGLTILRGEDLPGRLLELKLRDLPGIGHNIELRLNNAGIHTMPQLFALQARHMRAIWGSVWGEKMWYYLRGIDLPDAETEATSSIGHSHVLAPEVRVPKEAYDVAKRLTMKAAARLRRANFYASRFSLSLRLESGQRFGLEAQCRASMDSFTFLELLEKMWAEIMREARGARVKKLGVTLYGLTATADIAVQQDLFDSLTAPAEEKRQQANETISKAMDKLNQKFGKNTVLLGMAAHGKKDGTSTKIAFTRIPDVEEFRE